MPRFSPHFFPSTKVSSWAAGAFGGGKSVPGVPGTLALSGGEDTLTEIKLTWSPGLSGSELVTGYHIEVSSDGSSWSDQVADTGSTVVTYTATGLGNGVQRYYRVSAINDVGESDPGNEPNQTTSDPVAYSTTGSPSASNYTVSGVAYKSLHWTASGSFTPTSIPSGKTFDYWVVSGGGGGGGTGSAGGSSVGGAGGGGGGGAKVFTSNTLSENSAVTVTVGAGGTAGVSGGSWGVYNGGQGGATTIGSSSTTGGGGGAKFGLAGGSGGSGGGSAGANSTNTAGISGEGSAGGGGDGDPNYPGGGGGGKGGVGGEADNAVGGNGGDGGTNDYSAGITVAAGVGIWAGGGGGGGSTGGAAGSGGGAAQTGNGSANTGGGGGSDWAMGTDIGAGGSGAAVIRWAV